MWFTSTTFSEARKDLNVTLVRGGVVVCKVDPWAQGYETLLVLNSIEYEIYHSRKC